MAKDFGVSTFLSHFRDGVAKPNRYRVELTLPRGVNPASEGSVLTNPVVHQNFIRTAENYFNKNGQHGRINIKCHTANFPYRSLLTYDVKQNAAPFNIPYSASYDAVTFSFYADADLDTRAYFSLWQSTTFNSSTNTMNFYNEYISDIKIILMDSAGNDRYSETLFEAFPLNIGSVDLSYSNNDTYTTIPVTFKFKRWQSDWDMSGSQTTV